MSIVIKSGDSGNVAEVDEKKRLRTFSVTQEQTTSSSLEGDTFFITHDIVNVTTANKSFVFHMENTDTVDWIIDAFVSLFGLSTGGTGKDFKSHIVRNPTGGTLISAGTAGSAINMNLGSPKVLAGTFLKGVEGSTSTGGEENPDGIILKDQTLTSLTGGVVVIAAGTSVNFGLTPATGNTSMNVKLTLIIHRNVV